jgi:hypothetical protein
MDIPPRELRTLVRTLASYLYANPNASNSADGIRRWWLDEGFVVTADDLEKALAWMKRHGLIDETVAADGRVRFRRSSSDAQLESAIRDSDKEGSR